MVYGTWQAHVRQKFSSEASSCAEITGRKGGPWQSRGRSHTGHTPHKCQLFPLALGKVATHRLTVTCRGRLHLGDQLSQAALGEGRCCPQDRLVETGVGHCVFLPYSPSGSVAGGLGGTFGFLSVEVKFI